MHLRTRDGQQQAPVAELHELARLHGAQVAYDDVTGQRHEASVESLLAVLEVLGAPLPNLEAASDALRERIQAQWRSPLEPVVVAWDGGPVEVPLRLPASQANGSLECRLHLEEGGERRWSGRLEELPEGEVASVEGISHVVKRLTLPQRLPLGYHRLEIELSGRRLETLLLSAPTRAYSPRGPGWERSWGAFLPLYALHSRQSWGAGDFADLRALTEWVGELGGGFVATLPLLAAFLDEPYEVSPYSPASRLFWNEFYLHVPGIPELAHCTAARSILESPEFAAEVAALRSAPLVDYRRQMTLKRRVLVELARSFFAAPSDRQGAFERFAADSGYLEDYAAFRAVGERLRKPWPEWPARLRDGDIRPGDYADEVRRYHQFVQWLADEQLGVVSQRARADGPGLYLDLPLGVNANGYDVWRERQAFAVGVTGGCPPDLVFTRGQNWGFVPLHPEGIRAQGYRYVRAFVRHQLRFAGVLRIDHMPSFHRVFWIPPGMEATDGVYVRYPAEELYALFCLESHRHRALLVGEDLGTVPPEVPLAMARHNFHRMYVVQYELKADPGLALPDPPASSVASVNTHDMPPFAAYWQGTDLGERLELGLVTQEQSWEEEKTRRSLCAALARFLQSAGLLGDEPDAREVLRACLAHLGSSPARLLLVNLEDLWQETASQNVPSTSGESPNWRRKALHALEDLTRMPGVQEILAEVRRAIPVTPVRREKNSLG
jgi:4-alpha-glucanotransferase